MSEGLRVLVTGANRGLGLGLVQQFMADGHSVHACCRDPRDATDLAVLATKPRGRLDVHELDIARTESIATLADKFRKSALDIVVNNAATYGPRGTTLDTLDPQAWADVHATNVVGPVLLARALLPALSRGRRPLIANMSSWQGSIAGTSIGGKYAYRTSKTALNMATKCLAVDLRDKGLICLSIEPGWVRTRMGEPGAQIDVAESTSGIKNVLVNAVPSDSGRFLDYQGKEVPW